MSEGMNKAIFFSDSFVITIVLVVPVLLVFLFVVLVCFTDVFKTKVRLFKDKIIHFDYINHLGMITP